MKLFNNPPKLCIYEDNKIKVLIFKLYLQVDIDLTQTNLVIDKRGPDSLFIKINEKNFIFKVFYLFILLNSKYR